MRIALVTESLHAASDAATTVHQVADRLDVAGHVVLVVAPAPGLHVGDTLAAFGPDLVHVTSPGEVGRKALKHAGRLGVPTLVLQQEPVAVAAGAVWRRKVAARADRLVVTCRWMQSRLDEVGAPDADLWAPGVDTAGFDPRLRDDGLHAAWSRRTARGGEVVVVGHVGSLHKRNGVRELADVARVPGTRLVVVGDGPQRDWLERHVPGVALAGPLGGRELAVAIASLDVLVHPATEETSCHALRAAAASGVPVVTPAAGGAPDAVVDGRTGLLPDPADGRGLRRAVASLAGDPELRAALGRRARHRALERSWADAVEELVARHYAPLLGLLDTAA